ncbi:hypothetical protein FQ775_20695 [Nitratireductor mangrovi]|uniref:Uncharacterized protein n=1 Tax=Nitratireductor mangrovi TaxID=2599600 RepID=A0A5B8L3W5_9HYPH|nr:hypothetical protein [Nitratireductor mangrovi]QDZ02594.1 hypothetical protein FQ775_20695 [Nitratireductor mangrovi]
MTREQIISIVGPVDDDLVADLIASGASPRELREAWGWLHNEEALIGAGRPLPGSRVSELIDILDPPEDET